MPTGRVTVVDHPLVQHKLTYLRDKNRSTKGFRQILNEIGMLLAYEVTRDLPLEPVTIETPLQPMEGRQIQGKKLVLAPILRAGVGFLDGMLSLVPSARVAHVGLYRDPDTLEAVEYYFKAPVGPRRPDRAGPRPDAGHRATRPSRPWTGSRRGAPRTSASSACWRRPEGLAKFQAAHPDVPVWTAAIDSHLNEHGYIVPGLGDAGDRMYGTR